ncbi:MAG: transcription-repair coupling factor [Lentisphaeria bacterium]|nr:transcription-repair coupling factor [Lentisphaeria bacterium]
MKLSDFISDRLSLLEGQTDPAGVDPAALGLYIAQLVSPDKRCLVVLPEQNLADQVFNDLVGFYTADTVSYIGKTPLTGMDSGQSLSALHRLGAEQPGLYLVTYNDLVAGIQKQDLQGETLVVGESYRFNNLETMLDRFGFTRERFVVEPGTYAVRGGVIDFFPGESEHPVRLDFWGDTLDSARQFEPESQRSILDLKEVHFFSQKPFDDESTTTLLDLLPSNITTVFYRSAYEPQDRVKTADTIYKYFINNDLITILGGVPENFPGRIYSIEPQASFHRNLTAFRHRLDYLHELGYQILITAESKIQTERLESLFDEEKFLPVVFNLSAGFIDHTHHFAILTDHQIFDRRRRRNIVQRFFPSRPLTTVDEFNENDFVVHLDFGVGKYRGVEVIRVAGVPAEVLAIEYQDGDTVYVPVDKMDRVHKYEGGDGPPKITRLRSTEWDQLKFRTKKAVENYAIELMAFYARRFQADGHAFNSDTDLQKKVEAAFLYNETSDQLQATREIKADMESSRPMDRLLCGDVGFGKTEVAIRAAFKAVSDSKQVAILVPTTILAQQHYETFRERLDEFAVKTAVLSRFRSTKEIKETLAGVASGDIDILVGTHRLLSKDIQFKDLGLLVVDEEHRFGVKHKEKIKELKLGVDCLSMTATPIPRTLQMSLMGVRDFSQLSTPPRERQPIDTKVVEYRESVIRDAILRELDRGGQIYFVHNRVESIGIMLEKLQHLVPEARFIVGHGQMKGPELERVMLGFFHREYDVLLSTAIVESGLDNPNTNTILINRADAFGLSQLYQLRGRVGRSNRRAYAILLTPPFRQLNINAARRLNALERHSHYGGGYEIAMRDLEIRGSGNLFGTEQSGHIANIGYKLYTQILTETLDELKAEAEDQAPIYPKPDVKIDMDMLIPEDYVVDPNERVSLYRRIATAVDVNAVQLLQTEIRDRFGRTPPEVLQLLDSKRIQLLGQMLGLRSITIKPKQASADFHKEVVTEQGAGLIGRLSRAIEKTQQKVEIFNNAALPVVISIPTDKNALSEAKQFLEALEPAG